MQFGIMFANVGVFASSRGARAIGRAAEATGFDSVWTVEHVLVPAGACPSPRPSTCRTPSSG